MAAIGSSTLGVYNPIFYAQEALIHLENQLGMATRVHRGFDSERSSFGKGDVINIRKPDTFSAGDAPATAAGVETETVAITLNKWREVKFALTDKELALTGQRIIDDHIAPATYALANDIDSQLCGLWKDVGLNVAHDATANSGIVANITGARKAMLDQGAPVNSGNMHYMMDTTEEQLALQSSTFAQHQGAGNMGVTTQMTGSFGNKYGLECFTNQNVETSTAGTHDGAGAIDNGSGYAVGTTTIHVDALGQNKTIKIGQTVEIGDHSYVVTADVTTSDDGQEEADIAIYPGLRVAVADNDVVTIQSAAKSEMLAFHRNAFALALAPLPEIGNELGAKVATVTDPKTGLSIRSRLYYVGNTSQVHVALDVLYGVKTLDPYLACRVQR